MVKEMIPIGLLSKLDQYENRNGTYSEIDHVL